MKNIYCLLIATGMAATTYAQGGYSSGLFLGLNLKGGKLKEKTWLMPANWIYEQGVNGQTSKAVIENDMSYGFDVQAGYFFGKKGKWGVSTGLVYMRSEGTITVDYMHAEYKSTDFRGETFRQLVTTATPIKETMETTNISIPLLLKYRTMFSKNWGFMMDAGILYNAKMTSSYTASGTFDYEAIYKFEKQGEGYVAVYDNSPTPHASSWLLTEEQYLQTEGDGGQAEYFASLRAQGYNVGLDVPGSATGEHEYTSGSIGLLLQPSLSLRLSSLFSLHVGPYYMIQSPTNTREVQKIMLTDELGSYNTVLNNATRRRMQNYGVNLGLDINF